MKIEGATSEEIARGIDAAHVVYDREGIAAEVAASGMFALQVWGIKGSSQGEEPSKSQKVAVDVWLKAKRAAYEACCAGWREQPAISRWALCLGPTEPKVKTANPATWPERQQLYPKLIERLEAATGPDRQLDIDICYVMGWVNERGRRKGPLNWDCHISRAIWPRLPPSPRSLSRTGRSRLTRPLATLASSRWSATNTITGACSLALF
ncbi:hypothetical protein [Mesorhizobium sp. M0139]|uniref:hypothetical protein n=1 Tax=Mesorhizobium sp. M0139 TaxID=2956892 RepID=UPI00333C58F5